ENATLDRGKGQPLPSTLELLDGQDGPLGDADVDVFRRRLAVGGGDGEDPSGDRELEPEVAEIAEPKLGPVAEDERERVLARDDGANAAGVGASRDRGDRGGRHPALGAVA